MAYFDIAKGKGKVFWILFLGIAGSIKVMETKIYLKKINFLKTSLLHAVWLLFFIVTLYTLSARFHYIVAILLESFKGPQASI
jgi:hypothetical protein